MCEPEESDAEHVPIDGTLDLHMFEPRDIKDLVGDYLDECVARGVLRVRIIHGKGIGVQREIVHSALRGRADVLDFGLAGEGSGSWGATWVELKAPRAPG